MADLFEAEREQRRAAAQPLAARMRPRTLDEVIGQDALVGRGAAFRTVVESGRPPSMILWGPPGTGKTTLARLIATTTDGFFEQLSAVSAGIKDVREVLTRARSRLGEGRGRTILFLDEIHRFTKAQQDGLLPGVEDGTIILVGATTENPFFEVNSPLISRSSLFRLSSLEPDSVWALINRAMQDHDRGLGALGVELDDEAGRELAERVGGDARLALNTLETAATLAAGRGGTSITVSDVEEALQRRIIRYDKGGDRHYDVISAFIKSVRGSDPDAAVYWLHTMLEAGEDPEFVMRRMIILASEDIGLADPRALSVACHAAHALSYVGLPEASYALTQAALYLALAPKSNSVARAIGAARQAVRSRPTTEVPAHLRSSSYPGAEQLGHGAGYRYPHDDPTGVVAQQYLPDELGDAILFRPGAQGDEERLAKEQAQRDRKLGKRR
ncbi:MAG: replication-associated recombination protein A [Acidimicrobiia bacterium]|nr:replication-associated recombination protein A [Acidimicrobiia bacterium]